jgi:S1-C subfamily serine protease
VLLESIGTAVRARFLLAPLAVVDGIGGALLLGAVALGLAWIAGAVALQTPGARQFRDDIQRSAILKRLNDVLPPSGTLIRALSRVDPFPRVRGPEARVPRPTSGILADGDVRAAGRSVVRIRGTACGLSVEGSGWIARRDVVVTNAHVVAGQDDTTVEPPDGEPIDAELIGFDPTDDVAVLRVESLGAPPLAQREDKVGTPVAILGYPENGPFRPRPGRLGSTVTALSEDAYGVGPVKRRITAIRGDIRSGNSGGPAVDASGRVAATVFGASRSGPKGGFGVPPDVVARDLARANGPVGSGPCVR